MKAIIAIIFLLNLQISYSQTDSKNDESSKDEKPSWGTRMPTREAAPDLKLDADLDEDDSDDDDFGMDRSRMLDSEEPEVNDSLTLERPVLVSIEESAKIDEQKAEEARVAAENLKIQEKKAEDDRIAADLLRAQEAKAAEEKIAADQLKEQQRLAEEKRITDQIANEDSQPPATVEKEEASQENIADGQDQLSEVVVTAPVLSAYQWKKIKNALPVYPTKAAREKKEGWVEVKITIDAAGDVVDTVVVRSSRNYRIFNNAALKAVRKWKFEPPTDYGIDNQLSKVVRIVFQL